MLKQWAQSVVANMSRAEKRETLSGNMEPAEWIISRMFTDLNEDQVVRVSECVLECLGGVQ